MNMNLFNMILLLPISNSYYLDCEIKFFFNVMKEKNKKKFSKEKKKLSFQKIKLIRKLFVFIFNSL